MSSILQHLPQNATLAKQILESFEIAEKTCSLPSIFCTTPLLQIRSTSTNELKDEAEKLPSVGVTFHDLMVILSGIATLMCCLMSSYILCGHFFHWTNPKEQKQSVEYHYTPVIMSFLAYLIAGLFSVSYIYQSMQPSISSQDGFTAQTTVWSRFCSYIMPRVWLLFSYSTSPISVRRASV